MADDINQIARPQPGEMRDNYLSDLRIEAKRAGKDVPPTGLGTDNFFWATAVENITQVGLQNIEIANDNQSVSSATGTALNDIRKAEGLPIVQKRGSRGRIQLRVDANALVPQGQQWTLPNGVRIESLSTVVNPADYEEVEVRAIDQGEQSNAKGGTKVTIVGSITGIRDEALVAKSKPLTGGSDGENEEQKRARIQARRREPSRSTHWEAVRDVCLNANGDIKDVYIYEGLGGPSSTTIAVSRDFDRKRHIFSREASAQMLKDVEDELFRVYGAGHGYFVKSVDDVTHDLTFRIALPAYPSGKGWANKVPWPPLVEHEPFIMISSKTNNKQFTISARTTTEPIPGETMVAWWSRADQVFYQARVIAFGGTSTAWQLTLESPLVDSDGNGPQLQDNICPLALQMVVYSGTIVDVYRAFGPVELTRSADIRDKRLPEILFESPAEWDDALFCEMQRRHPEISDYKRAYAATTSTHFPSTTRASDPPLWVPGYFALHPL